MTHIAHFWGRLLLILVLVSPGSVLADRRVTDPIGRSLTVPDHAVRIVSLAPNITEIVFALGQGARLVGATQFADHPPEAKALPKVGSYVRLDLERILALKPDLCLAIKDGNPKHTVERLMSLGIPVFVIDPRNLTSVMADILAIGELLNVTPKSTTLVADMRQRIKQVKQLVSQTQHTPRVFLQIGIAPIISIGSDSVIHELIETAGGENVAAGPAPYPHFSKEQVLGLMPEVFIITSMARKGVFDQVKRDWEQWSQIPAIRDNRIFLLDSNLFDRPTHRLVDGLEVLVKVIHPELFYPQ